MLQVKLNDKLFNCPENYSEISLKKFQAISAIPKPDKPEDELEYKVDILSELLECYVEDLHQVKLSSLGELWKKCSWIVEKNPDAGLPDLIKLSDGKLYYFDSNLDNSLFGMWVDLEDLMKQDFWTNAHKICSIFVRPVDDIKYDYSKWKGWKKTNYPIKSIKIQKYDPAVADRTAELLLDAPVSIIYTISVFFWIFLSELHKRNLLNYMEVLNQEQRMEMLKKIEEVDLMIQASLSIKDGDGMLFSEN